MVCLRVCFLGVRGAEAVGGGAGRGLGLQQCFDGLGPGFDLGFRGLQAVAAVGVESDLQVAGKRCAGAGLFMSLMTWPGQPPLVMKGTTVFLARSDFSSYRLILS